MLEVLSKPSVEVLRPQREEQSTSNKSNTILIIIIIVLVGIIGLAAGYILFGSVNHPTPITNNTTNMTVNNSTQTNTPVNNSIQNNTSPTSEITANQAYDIAVNYAMTNYGATVELQPGTSIELTTTQKIPAYEMVLVTTDGTYILPATLINAETGAVINEPFIRNN